MNKVCKEKLQKAVEFLKNLHFKEENIMVTGSIALDLQGVLPAGREIHDVDLIVRMTDQDWRCMKLLEAINNVDEQSNEAKEKYEKDMLLFKIDGLTINIWRGDTEWSTIKDAETGVYVATVDHIILAKKSYGRGKDLQDIMDICKKMLNNGL